MKKNGKRLFTVGAALLFSIPLAASARPVRQNTAPDNTRTNKQDRQQSSPTADQQKANSSDTDITKQIRSSVVKDKSLSTYAHNVKIIVQDGKVTLKGPVRSEEEKSNIAAKAAAVAGESNVTNQLTIALPKQ
jgi:hyperosmotically inducible periplasmic protein